MATYNFNCPKCAQIIAADLSMVGQMLQCPQCQQTFSAPVPSATASSPAPAGKVGNEPLSIWSLVLGILGVCCCGLGIFSGIPAVICGHKAQKKIKASCGTLAGAGMALAGLILGYIAIGLTVIVLPLQVAIAIPSFMKARQEAQRTACVNNLRMIDHAKQQLATANTNVTDSYVPAMSELAPYLMKRGKPMICPEGGVYSVNAMTSNPTCSKGPTRKHALPNAGDYD
jgi:hypothetical protein